MHAYGVALVGREPIEGVLAGPGPQLARRTVVHLDGPRSVERVWPQAEARRLVERRRPDGRLFVAIDHAPSGGYRIEAPEYGVHVVSPDGERWIGAPAPGPAWHWQKLVFAQVLPTIAVLQGLETFHASAVAIGQRAYGLIAPSGMGKSSTAAHLIAEGARFFADDVLAVEEVSGRLVTHPGPQVVNAYGHELDAMSPSGRSRLGTLLGESDKRHLRPCGAQEALPLAALLFLTRASVGPPVRVERLDPDPGLLLVSTYAPHVTSDQRLERQLSVCATLDRQVPLWKVTAGGGATAREVAAALWRRFAGDRA
jgi:hypothetical protein